MQPSYAEFRFRFSAFNNSLSNLSALASLAPDGPSSTAPLTATFLENENHDQPRFVSYTSDNALTKNAMAWPFVTDGIPIIYYGQEQGYAGSAEPYNRRRALSGYMTEEPLVAHAQSLTAVCKVAIAGNASFLAGPARWISQSDPSTLMLSKPPLTTLLTNIGTTGTRRRGVSPRDCTRRTRRSRVRRWRSTGGWGAGRDG
ncbi:hypothetical protein DFH07DRAFT_1000740 [Mycena maculata]|uniref:Glycosyl hydrolase family 13 catalytic domain-containing protein n=1 Tax=Mycena maculata TaxID=230809 RepID=A0AAD7HRG5_9AGAR|nr:hypothetical protein DFH07DRAFT_1000740 [Mycena maculata]